MSLQQRASPRDAHLSRRMYLAKVTLVVRPSIVILALLSACLAGTKAENPALVLDDAALVDQRLREKSELVLRARVVRNEGGSKYWLLEVEPLSVYKAPPGFEVSKSLEIYCLSIGQGLPLGTTTIYLVRYNPDHPEYGWKLLEEYEPREPDAGKFPDRRPIRIRKGYSHHTEP